MNIMYKRILAIALPMILSNITIPLLGIVDNAVMGHLTHAYFLASVGVGVIVFNFLYYGFGFLRMSTTGLVAQAQGVMKLHTVNAVVMRAVTFAVIIAVIILAVKQQLLEIALSILKPSAVLTHYINQYYSIRIFSAPAVLINYVFIGMFIGQHKPKKVLVLTLLVNVTAMMLDYLLVFILKMDVRGLALSAVTAQWLGTSYCFMACYEQFKTISIREQWRSIYCSGWKSLFQHNTNIFIRTMLLLIVFTYFTKRSLVLGVDYLAANMVLLNFQEFVSYALDGFANAAEALVGESVGLSSGVDLSLVIKHAGIISCSLALCFSSVYYFSGQLIISMITSIEHIRMLAHTYLVFIILSPMISCWSYWMDGVYVGITATTAMRNTMILSALSFFITNYYLQQYANYGLWTSFLVFMAVRGITMLCRLRRHAPYYH